MVQNFVSEKKVKSNFKSKDELKIKAFIQLLSSFNFSKEKGMYDDDLLNSI